MPNSLAATYLFLVAAIVAEVIATSALAKTENFTRLLPSIITVAGYTSTFVIFGFPDSHVADDCLAAISHVDITDTDRIGPVTLQRLHLRGVGSR